MDVLSNNSAFDKKIENVLKRLLDSNFKINNDVYLNSLLTHIQKYQENNSDLNCLTNTVFCWITQATEVWEGSKQKVSPKILSFALNLASLISKDETTFVKFNSMNIYERLLKIMNVTSAPPTIKLGLVTLMSSFLEHKSGLQWIIATNYWSHIVSFTSYANTIYITSAGCKFITELLDKAIHLNESFCKIVVKTLTEPLDQSSQGPSGDSSYVEDKNLPISETLFPVLKATASVLQMLLKRTNIEILDIFINDCKLLCKMKKLLLLSEGEDFEFELRNIMYLIGLTQIFQHFSGFEKIICAHVPETNEEGLFETFRIFISKGYTKSLLKLCYMAHIYWKSIGNKMPVFFQKDQQITSEIQLIMMQNMPIVMIGPILLGYNKVKQLAQSDTSREDYISKTIQLTGTRTMYAAFQWRNFLLKDPNLFDDLRLSLIYILKSKSFYTREGGVIMFQAFIYSLKDITTHVTESPPHMRHPLAKFLELLLEAIGTFIEEFNITWKDSIESMSVMILAVEILHVSMWTPKVVVKALNLLRITISKYMPPSMVLLVDPAHDSSLTSVGALLYAKCNDPYWEVRDSSLEVLCTMSFNANTRFPSLQGIILGADLPNLVVKIAINDMEPFVRASAVRCLQEMIQVQEFWENLLKIESLHEKFFDIVVKETEGIVRKEAATLICKIYDHQNYPGNLLSTLYDIMTHAAIADLHWEVKLNALQFWQCVINKHLQNQGMIDGTFPKVTFSKENRKIVKLNDIEIKKRLIKVLNQLSETGCLAVLVEAIQDDYDIQVVKSAIHISNEFVRLLQCYQITEQNSNLGQPPSPLFSLPNAASTSQPTSSNSALSQNEVTPKSSNIIQIAFNNCLSICTEMDCENLSISAADVTDDILEEILNCSDTKVLKSLYNPNDNVYPESVSVRKKVVLAPSDFVTFTCNNFESNLLEKNKWLNGIDDFDSLLDDILRDYNITDVNSRDCY